MRELVWPLNSSVNSIIGASDNISVWALTILVDSILFRRLTCSVVSLSRLGIELLRAPILLHLLLVLLWAGFLMRAPTSFPGDCRCVGGCEFEMADLRIYLCCSGSGY